MKKQQIIKMFFFLLIAISCSSESTRKNKESLPADSLTELALFEKEKDFEILEYKKTVDSLLTNIFRKNIYSELIIDTVSKGNMIFPELIETPLKNIVDNTIKNVKYKFALTNRHNIDFIILSFKDKYTADSVFNIFEYVATTKKIGVPGITYANDYLALIKNEIYWIHTGCLYAYFNHLKFVNILNNMIDNSISKFIECECGQVICSVGNVSNLDF